MVFHQKVFFSTKQDTKIIFTFATKLLGYRGFKKNGENNFKKRNEKNIKEYNWKIKISIKILQTIQWKLEFFSMMKKI